MSGTTTDADVTLVLGLERELQTRACRSNPARVGRLLAPDFTEVDASGRLWDLPRTLELLASQAEDGKEIEVRDLTGRVLADGVILVRWDSAYDGRRARRTSVWRQDAEGWRLVHHQGTLLPGNVHR